MKLLKANPDIKHMSIEGHTDNRGALEMNNKLSQDRADSVMKYLSSHGIAEDRLEAHGYGPARPIESNDTRSGAPEEPPLRVPHHAVSRPARPALAARSSSGSRKPR